MRLEIKDISFSYTSHQKIFENFSFSMETGELLCLLGPNGCGKTTLLNCVAGLLQHDNGDIAIDGESVKKLTPSERAKIIGYVPQNIIAAFDYTVIDYVVTGCAPHMKLLERPKEEEYERAQEALKRMNIEHLANKSYARISGGERQLVSIARVIVQRPKFIMMDEPTAHLDFGNQIRLLRLAKEMKEEGYGVLMTTHNPDQVLMLDSHVVVMNKDGYQTSGLSSAITEEVLHSIYDEDIVIDKAEKSHRTICIARGL